MVWLAPCYGAPLSSGYQTIADHCRFVLAKRRQHQATLWSGGICRRPVPCVPNGCRHGNTDVVLPPPAPPIAPALAAFPRPTPAPDHPSRCPGASTAVASLRATRTCTPVRMGRGRRSSESLSSESLSSESLSSESLSSESLSSESLSSESLSGGQAYEQAAVWGGVWPSVPPPAPKTPGPPPPPLCPRLARVLLQASSTQLRAACCFMLLAAGVLLDCAGTGLHAPCTGHGCGDTRLRVGPSAVDPLAAPQPRLDPLAAPPPPRAGGGGA